jgi:hypothetical protein
VTDETDELLALVVDTELYAAIRQSHMNRYGPERGPIEFERTMDMARQMYAEMVGETLSARSLH